MTTGSISTAADTATQKKDQIELHNVMDSLKKALMRGEEDKAKEREEFRKIESEQRAAAPSMMMEGKKAQCIKVLGAELYERIYQYMKKAKMYKIDFQIMQKELNTLLGKDKDKMNMAFLIEQIIECETMKTIYV